MRPWAAALATAWLIGSGAARAELLEVRQVAAGMECPECARGLKVLVKQLDGVEEAATSWNRRVLTVRFKPGSHATLAQIRALVVRQHFQAREAEVVISGRLRVDSQGWPILTVPESGLTYRMDPAAPSTTRWIAAAGSLPAASVVVTGRVPAGADATGPDDPLILWALAIRAAPRPPPTPRGS